MLGMSGVELMIILALALILLGPDQLPSVAKTLGKGLREIRKATEDLKSTFEQEMVKLEDDAPKPPGPRILPPFPADPGSARASARSAATAPPTPADPASARAAARRGVAAPTTSVALSSAGAVKLVPAQGTIAREAAFAAQPTPLAAVSPEPGTEPGPAAEAAAAAPMPAPDEPQA